MERRGSENSIQTNSGQKFPKCSEEHKSTDSASWDWLILSLNLLFYPNKVNPKKSISRHMIVKLLKTKDKEKVLKEAKEKWHFTCKGKTVEMTVNFTSETIKARRK